MSRINTNVSSLVAQKTLARSNNQLQQSLTRLSTGLRINVGKDDPAGLIASESLRSDITATQKGITNSERANQLIATADSALGQVSSLLNDVRGLVSEAANLGALSPDQIAANQLQLDSSLEAIDRIAQITSFQGRKLLDGSLDFISTGVDNTKVEGLRIDQANFGTQTTIGVAVNVVKQATLGQLNFSFGAVDKNVVLEVGGANGTEAFNFAAGSSINEIATAVNLVSDATGVRAEVQKEATKGSLTVSSLGANNDIKLDALTAGFDAGNIDVKYVKGDSTGTTATYTAGAGGSAGTLEVSLKTQADVAATGSVDDSAVTAAAALTLGSGNSGFTVTSRTAGYAGNNYQVAVDVGAGSIGVAVAGNVITISTTAASISANAAINLLNTDTDSKDIVVGTLASGSTGAGTIGSDVAATNLTGGVGDDNNALNITAKLSGTQFNGTAINFVDGDLLQRAAFTAGTDESVSYSADATKARAHLNLGTAGSFGLNLTATTAGSQFNGVKVNVTNASIGDAATVTYDADNKVLNVVVDDSDETTVGKLKDAINAEGTFTAALEGATAITDVVDTSDTTGTNVANTGFSGGDANTLFVTVKDGTSTANNVLTALSKLSNRRAAELFDVSLAAGNDGTGKLTAQSISSALSGGVNGGAVVATANDVVSAINNSSASTKLKASLAGTDTGFGIVGAFEESASYGSKANENALQFIGGKDSLDVKFTSAANQALSVTDGRGFSSLTRISDAANSNLTITAKGKGTAFDGVSVAFVDDDQITKGNEVVTYDEKTKTLKFLVASGNTAGNNTTAADIKTALEGDDYASTLFSVSHFGSSTGAGEVNVDLRQAKVDLAIAGGNNNFTVRSKEYGAAGDNLKVVLAAGAVGSAPSVAFNSGTGTLTLTVDDTVTTTNTVKQLVADSAYADKFEIVSTEGTGAGTISVAGFTTATSLTGGVGTDAGNHIPSATPTTSYSKGGLSGTALTVNLATNSDGIVTTTANDLIAYFAADANQALLSEYGISVSNAGESKGTGKLAATTSNISFATAGVALQDAQPTGTSTAVNGNNARIKVTAASPGSAFDGVTVVLKNNDLITSGNETAAYNADSKTLTIEIDEGSTTADQVISAITAQVGDKFTAEEGGGGDGSGLVTANDSLTLTGGVVETGTRKGVALSGNADQADKGLTFVSTQYGSDQFVSVKALSGSFELTDSAGVKSDRSVGTDVNARINGIQAIGKGLKASLNTASLDLSFSVNDDVADGQELSFNITGGGALFQLGPKVVSNQQARLGIQSVSTATLGGVNGRLFELRSGGAKALDTDTGGAAKVVDEVISVVTQLRGRLGAFQKTTLQTNIYTLNDTLANLTEAESSIRDADFAAESAQLTRNQILVQSGTSVLGIANQNPQNVLSLLR